VIYFDSAYLAKCYLAEPGHREVRTLAERAGPLKSVEFAKIEVAAVFHRHRREGRFGPKEHKEFTLQFVQDCADGIVSFIPVSPALLEAAHSAYQALPPAFFLRSADCLHLCAARQAGFKEIYANDRHLLAAASHFGLRGIDVILPVAT
jgi:predicted nucleic acid-binding protein